MVETVLPTVSDFIPEIVCLGVDCIVCGIVYTAYVFTNRAITSVCSAAKFDLDKQVYVITSINKSIKLYFPRRLGLRYPFQMKSVEILMGLNIFYNFE